LINKFIIKILQIDKFLINQLHEFFLFFRILKWRTIHINTNPGIERKKPEIIGFKKEESIRITSKLLLFTFK